MATGVDRREFLASVAAGVAAAGSGIRGGQEAAVAARPSTPPGALAPPAFTPLPLGAVRPTGWLLRQLRLQADGLTGHLDEFWPDVARSQWFGGDAEGWERAPYWLDGAIPLAWLVDDEGMKRRITRYVSHIVEHQRPDGWYAPYPEDAVAKRYDMWAILLANKALVQFHEATGEARVLDAVVRSLKALLAGVDRTPLYNWGRFRWFEGLVPIYYAHERTGEPWLLDLARKLRAQGVDFDALYRTPDVAMPTPRRGLWKWTKHVVNHGMAVKSPALIWRLDQQQDQLTVARRMLDVLARHHGQVTGMFSGDECLAGRNPLQGTELCAVVEFMYSLEHLFAVFGAPEFADLLERVAFNALPATLSPDLWSHQYDQQVNQVQCTINPEHNWTTNGPESNLFGLEPNFGCCTSNLHQGWPKFAAHLWMRAPDDGLVAAAYAPSRVRVEARGVPVSVTLDTEYPFREQLVLSVSAARSVRFALWLRVPAWTRGAFVRVGDGAAEPMSPGTLHRVEREWAGETRLAVTFPMQASASRRDNDAIAIERGPLVYALRIGEQWTRVNADKPHRELPHADFEVTPTTPWNYGLLVDEAHVDRDVRFEPRPVGDRPFSPEGAGMSARVRGRAMPGWKLSRGWAGELSLGDGDWADASRVVADGPVEDLELIPYGCTNLRITEFPVLKGNG